MRSLIATTLLAGVGLFGFPAAHAAPAWRAQCVAAAAAHYGVHPSLVKAVLRQEGGAVGRVSQNKNGTYDIGPMQINSSHLRMLSQYGITKSALLNDGCLNIFIGTWILKSEIVKAPTVWAGVGNYHSHTPALNLDYQWRVWRQLVSVERGR